MGSDELGIHSGGAGNRKADNERNEGEAPDRRCIAPATASHPAVTSFAPSIASAIAITESGAPRNRTAMPLIEKKAAAPHETIWHPL